MKVAVVGHVEWVDFVRVENCVSRASASSRPRSATTAQLGRSAAELRRTRRARRGRDPPRAATPRCHTRRRHGRADDHAAQPQAHPAEEGRPAPLGGAGRLRRGLLHRRRPGRPPRGPRGTKPRRHRARASDARRGGRAAGRARPQRPRPRRDLRRRAGSTLRRASPSRRKGRRAASSATGARCAADHAAQAARPGPRHVRGRRLLRRRPRHTASVLAALSRRRSSSPAARRAALALTRRGAYGGRSNNRVVCKCCVVEENGVKWRKVEGKGLSNDASGRIRAHGRREGAHHLPANSAQPSGTASSSRGGMDKCLYAYTPADGGSSSRTSSRPAEPIQPRQPELLDVLLFRSRGDEARQPGTVMLPPAPAQRAQLGATSSSRACTTT